PLVLPRDGGRAVQVRISAPDDSGRRAFSVHSRADNGDGWTRHAGGTLTADTSTADFDLAQWPPEGATALDIDALYPSLAERGLTYGPAFRGLRAAWRRGDEVFAEVALPEAEETKGFGIHPALLDATLHAVGAGGLLPDSSGQAMLPFAWSGVALRALGASSLRCRLRKAGGDGIAFEAVDPFGTPVISLDSLVFRPVTAEQLVAGRSGSLDSLYRVDWAAVEAADTDPGTVDGAIIGAIGAAGLETLGFGTFPDLAAVADSGEVPATVLAQVDADPAPDDLARHTSETVLTTLALLQEWLGNERFADSRLVFVTRQAVATEPGDDVPGLANAALRGLVRSAQSENPDRFTLLDLDDDASSVAAVPVALASGEPELAVRAGAVHRARLASAASGGSLVPPADSPSWRLDSGDGGTLEDLCLIATDDATRPLGVGEVRVGVRASGLNFRDVLISLGMYPGQALIG
ncbi:polyketide synthase dehydratase domain-containing protein, partial [Nocardiopsis listeri]|uniref:polyketide synthase dehydratase domain-containing protein n=1 Tax=Nocardiopsis listeri TaxID=53440 RepID=UPI001680C5FA